MSRNIPDFQTDHYYHIYNRGADKNPIFFEEDNYIFLLEKVKKYIDKFSISIIAYCLMTNHYHFLFRQDGKDSAGKCVQYIFNAYTKAVNKRYKRSGTLFEGPYRAIHIDDESYLLHLCRYVHRNPLEARLVEKAGDWQYSNYLEWIGKRNGLLYNPQFVKYFFSSGEKYQEFVENYDSGPNLDKYLFE